MFRKIRGRKTHRENLQSSKAWCDFYAGAGGRPKVENQLLAALPPKRHRVKRSVDGQITAPLEKEIQTAILEAIELRNDVIFVGRFNRGQAVASNGDGSVRYTPFNSVPGFPDIHGLLLGGKAFYLEVKRPPPNYKEPTTDQQDFLDAARNGGAYAGVVTSVDEAMAILP